MDEKTFNMEKKEGVHTMAGRENKGWVKQSLHSPRHRPKGIHSNLIPDSFSPAVPSLALAAPANDTGESRKCPRFGADTSILRMIVAH